MAIVGRVHVAVFGAPPVHIHPISAALLTSDLPGLVVQESTAKAIEYKDWSAPAFTAMLEFLYTGSVRDLTAQTALDVMGLADHTGLDGLRQLCASSLMHAIDGTSVCELISHAHRCGAAELKQACLEYILKHHSQVDLGSLKTEPELLLEVLQIAFRNRL